MTNENFKGMGDILELLRGIDPEKLNQLLAQTQLSAEDRKAISGLFSQVSSGQTPDANAKQNALALLLKIYSGLNSQG